MSANWELQLISSILRDEDGSDRFMSAIQAGVNQQMFRNAEARLLWSGMHFHFNRPDRYGHLPSEARLTEQHGKLELPSPQENFADLLDIIKNKHQRFQAEKAWEDFISTPLQDHATAFSKYSARINQISEQCQSKSDVDFDEVALRETVEDIENLEAHQGITGIPFPWERLNLATGGMQPGDYILIYALPKSMKTWVGLYIAVSVALTGRSVLIYSREMKWTALLRRIGCLLARIDYTRYKAGTLTERMKEELLEAIRWFIEECPGKIRYTDADLPDGSPGGPDDIRRKIEIYQPQMVLLDSAYMLEMPGTMVNPYDWKSMALVNRRCKMISKGTDVPLIAILQENERAALKYKNTRGTASLAMNTSAIQDCDLAIRAVYHKLFEEISLHLPAARETREPGFTINAKAAYDFGYAHDDLWEVGDDVEMLEDEDAAEDGAENVQESVATMRGRFIQPPAGEGTEGANDSG